MRQSNGYWSENSFVGEGNCEFTVRCQFCGRILIGGEGYYERDGKPYCEDCVESADLEDLIRICETDTDELYRSVGLSHGFVVGDV